MTASGAIAPGTTSLVNIPVGNSTFLTSICGVVTATPAGFPAGVKPYVVIVNGTTTSSSTGQTSIIQTTASGFASAFIPPVAFGSAGSYIAQLGLVATGTASATQTLAATTFLVGVGPQYV